MRIVVDTNVVISALVFGGVPRQVIDLVTTGACSLFFSPPIQAEVERILEEKFGWSPLEIGVRTRTLGAWELSQSGGFDHCDRG
jgi:predicted nucleic acid-binding protein